MVAQIKSIGCFEAVEPALRKLLAHLANLDNNPELSRRFLNQICALLKKHTDLRGDAASLSVLECAAFDTIPMAELSPLLAFVYTTSSTSSMSQESAQLTIGAVRKSIARRKHRWDDAEYTRTLSSLAGCTQFFEEPLCRTLAAHLRGEGVAVLLPLISDLDFGSLVGPVQDYLRDSATKAVAGLESQPEQQVVNALQLLARMVEAGQRTYEEDRAGYELTVTLLRNLVNTVVQTWPFKRGGVGLFSLPVLEVVKTQNAIKKYDADNAENICPVVTIRSNVAQLLNQMKAKTLQMGTIQDLTSQEKRPTVQQMLEQLQMNPSIIDVVSRARQKVHKLDRLVHAASQFFNRAEYKSYLHTDMSKVLADQAALNRGWEGRSLLEIEQEAIFTQFLRGHDDELEHLMAMEAVQGMFSQLRIKVFEEILSKWKTGSDNLQEAIKTFSGDTSKSSIFSRDRSTALQSQMSSIFLSTGKLTVPDFHGWLLPCLFMAWENVRIQVFTMCVPLAGVSVLFAPGSSPDLLPQNRPRLERELEQLRSAGTPREDFQSHDRVMEAMGCTVN